MYELTVEDTFDAAHYLRGYQGACERLHGHTYRIQATLRTPDINDTGISVDFRDIKSGLKDIVAELDHQCLNDLPVFSTTNPSAENIAKYIFDRLSALFGGRVFKVTVWETPTSAAAYFRESVE